MSISFSWSSEYETGIDIIDSQHKQLFDYLDQVELAIATENGGRV